MLKKFRLWAVSLFKVDKKLKTVVEKRSKATRHAKKRLEQRHGEILTDKMITSCISDIKNNKAEFLGNTEQSTQAWIVTYRNKKYRVIYNYKSETLVTVYSRVKDKKIKPNRRNKKKIRSRINAHYFPFGLEKTFFKKPYKRNKRVGYSEMI